MWNGTLTSGHSFIAGMAFAAVGIMVSDKIEERYPAEQRIENVPVVIDRS